VCSGISKGSLEQRDLRDYLSSICDLPFIENYQYHGKKEIDVYFPDIKTGFEYHGLFWHSEHKTGKETHRDKYNFSKEKGIRLVQVFQNEWLHNKEFTKRRISNILIEKKVSTFTFLDSVSDAEIIYGVFDSNRLVSVIVIRDREIINFDSRPEYNKVDIMNQFLKELDNDIEVIVDLRWLDHEIYESCGFVRTKDMPIKGWKFSGDVILSESNDSDDPTCIIYDCGYSRYRYSR
jgi:hypothetical protein